MNFSRSVLRSLTWVMVIFALAALGTLTSGQTQMPLPQAAPTAVASQAPSICGNQPFCYETQDFAAVVTDFRTSKSGYFGLIATTLRFVNKTSNPLVLGYANGSGTAQDDSGLRYGVGGANGVRGMGLVNGPYVDPKFVLQPGGFGDARFELAARLTPVYGITFELNLTVNEINTLEGNQHTVGGEFPLQFQGLTNGARGTVPGVPAGGAGMMASGGAGTMAGANGATTGGAAPACGPASTATAIAGATNSTAAQNAAATANTAVSNATAALSNLGSIFGKKKKPADVAPTANTVATVPCVPAVPNAATLAAAGAPAVSGAAPQAGGTGAPAGATPAGVGAATATKPAAGAATATAPATVTSPPASTPKAKAQPVKLAAKKGAAPTAEQKKTAENPETPKPPQQPQQH